MPDVPVSEAFMLAEGQSWGLAEIINFQILAPPLFSEAKTPLFHLNNQSPTY